MLDNLILLSFSFIYVFQYLEHLELLSPEIMILLVSLQINFLFILSQSHLLISPPVVEGSMWILIIELSFLPEESEE